jgi:hypothetical protein
MLQISVYTNKRHLYRATHRCKKQQLKLIGTNRIHRIRCAIKARRFIDTCAVPFIGEKNGCHLHYFFLLWWRVRASNFLCLCFRIFFLRFFMTLPTASPPFSEYLGDTYYITEGLSRFFLLTPLTFLPPSEPLSSNQLLKTRVAMVTTMC